MKKLMTLIATAAFVTAMSVTALHAGDAKSCCCGEKNCKCEKCDENCKKNGCGKKDKSEGDKKGCDKSKKKCE